MYCSDAALIFWTQAVLQRAIPVVRVIPQAGNSSVSVTLPNLFCHAPHPYHWVSEASRIELVQGLKAMEFLDLILCPISTSASINESGAAVLLRTAGSR